MKKARPSHWLSPLLLALLVAPVAQGEEAQAKAAEAGCAEELPELPQGDKLKFLVNHHFNREAAKIRIGQLLDYWKSRFGVTSRWAGDRVLFSGRVLGVEIRARLEVADGFVDGEASDPGLLLRSSAHEYINKKLRKYLSPNYEES